MARLRSAWQALALIALFAAADGALMALHAVPSSFCDAATSAEHLLMKQTQCGATTPLAQDGSAKLYTGMQGLVSYQQPHLHQALALALAQPARARRLLRLLPRQALHPRQPTARARYRRRQLRLSTQQNCSWQVRVWADKADA